MTGIGGPSRRDRWPLVALAVPWLLVGWLPEDIWFGAAIALVFLTAIAAAIVSPAHPLRNGTLGGDLARPVRDRGTSRCPGPRCDGSA